MSLPLALLAALGGFATGAAGGYGKAKAQKSFQQEQRSYEESQELERFNRNTMAKLFEQIAQSGDTEYNYDAAKKYGLNPDTYKVLAQATQLSPEMKALTPLIQQKFPYASGVLPGPPTPVAEEQYRGVQASLAGKQYGKVAEALGPQEAKRRTTKIGDMYVTEEMNPKTRQWETVATAPRFGRTPEDVAAQTAQREEAKSAAAAKDVAFAQGGDVAAAGTILGMLKEFGAGATGVRGALSERLSGLAGQVSPDLGEAMSNLISGASAGDVQKLRTQSRVFTAQMLQTVTQDESGRYTDKERQIAEETLKTLSLASSPEQIASAIETAMRLQLVARDRNLLRAGADTGIDFEDDASINSFGERMRALGLSDSAIDDLLQAIHLQRQVLQP